VQRGEDVEQAWLTLNRTGINDNTFADLSKRLTKAQEKVDAWEKSPVSLQRKYLLFSHCLGRPLIMHLLRGVPASSWDRDARYRVGYRGVLLAEFDNYCHG
jgi:hypothetical protein